MSWAEGKGRCQEHFAARRLSIFIWPKVSCFIFPYSVIRWIMKVVGVRHMGMVWGNAAFPFLCQGFTNSGIPTHEHGHAHTRIRIPFFWRKRKHLHSTLQSARKVCHANVAQACLERFCPPSRLSPVFVLSLRLLLLCLGFVRWAGLKGMSLPCNSQFNF